MAAPQAEQAAPLRNKHAAGFETPTTQNSAALQQPCLVHAAQAQGEAAVHQMRHVSALLARHLRHGWAASSGSAQLGTIARQTSHLAHPQRQLPVLPPGCGAVQHPPQLTCAVAGRRSGTYSEASPSAITSLAPITRMYESTASLEGRPPGWYWACGRGAACSGRVVGAPASSHVHTRQAMQPTSLRCAARDPGSPTRAPQPAPPSPTCSGICAASCCTSGRGALPADPALCDVWWKAACGLTGADV